MATLATRLSGWFAPSGVDRINPDDVRAGATFGRITETQIMETARVISVAEDEGGILHVRYSSRLHRADRTLDEGQRTLAVPSFVKRFEKLPSQHASAPAAFGPHALRLS